MLTEEAEQVQAASDHLDVDENCERIVDAVRNAAVEAFPILIAAPRARWFSQLAWQVRCARVGSMKEIRSTNADLRIVELKALFLCWIRAAGGHRADRLTRTLRIFVPLVDFVSLDKEASLLRLRRAFVEVHLRNTAALFKRIRRCDKKEYLAGM